MGTWFRNIETGQEWDVSHPEQIERLNGDPAFERVPVPASEPAREGADNDGQRRTSGKRKASAGNQLGG